MPVPEWVNRLRTGSYVSPKGVESFFKFDIVSRTGGKKASIHEILNSDDAIIQDQGNRVKSYPMNIYFVGDIGDQESDNFIQSLEEEYSAENPGTLKHPRWGDISVIPFSFQQNENYVKGAGIFRCQVEFKESIALTFPGIAGLNESEIVSNINTLEDNIDIANEAVDIDLAARYAEFRATIDDVVDIVVNGIGSVAALVKEVDDEFRSIQDDIDRALSVGATALEILGQVNKLIRLPAQIASNTITKIQGYGSMLAVSDPENPTSSPLTDAFLNNVNPQTNRVAQINNAVMMQSITSMVTSQVIEAALFTDLETRDTAGEVIDFINQSSDVVEEAVSTTYQTLADPEQTNVNITNIFTPDHNTGSSLKEVVSQANSLLISRSFDLKAKKTTILKAPIDALSLTYELYGTIDELEFLINTNKLTDVEIIEMPVGKSVISYV
jgi:prophage DNA circulation protein